MQKINVPLQYHLDHVDLALVLALVRGGSLARVIELLRADMSTVFWATRQLKEDLGKASFDRSRNSYLANQTTRRLAQRAGLVEQAPEATRIGFELERKVSSGTVCLTCSGAVLRGLLLPALTHLMPGYPVLQLKLVTSNGFANLSQRDADITPRMARTPPEYLVGCNLGEARYVPYANERYLEDRDAVEPAMLHWIAPDDFFPDHPSVVWRRRHHPGALPVYRCNGALAIVKTARAGLGLAAIPAYLLRDGNGLRVSDTDLKGCTSTLWLLTRLDCRALHSAVALFDESGRHVRSDDK